MKETFKNLTFREQNPPKKYIVQPAVQMVKDKTRCQVMNMILLIPRSVEMVIGKSKCISEGHCGAGLACGPASAHCIHSKS